MGVWAEGSGVVQFPDGRKVRGAGVRRPRHGPGPEFAVYLLSGAPDITDHDFRWVKWRDFALPASTEDAVSALREAHDRSPTQRVEIACGGGVGRTGTALSVLAIMSGVKPDEAISWVRNNYHLRAVETPWQRRWITGEALPFVQQPEA